MQSLFNLGSRLRVAVGNGIVSMGRAVAGVNAAEGRGIDVDDVKEPYEVFLARQQGREEKEPPRLPVAVAVPEVVRPGLLSRLGEVGRAVARNVGQAAVRGLETAAAVGRNYFVPPVPTVPSVYVEPPRTRADVQRDMEDLEILVNLYKKNMVKLPREPVVNLIDRIANSGFRVLMRLEYQYITHDGHVNTTTRFLAFSPKGVSIMKAVLLMGDTYESQEAASNELAGSDSYGNVTEIVRLLSIDISFIKEPQKKMLNRSVGLFPYVHDTEYNLERWQIMASRGKMNAEQEKVFEKDLDNLNKEHCLLFAMRQLGVPVEILHQIKQEIREGFYLETSHIGEMAKRHGFRVELHKYDNKNGKQTRVSYHGPENGFPVPLAVYDDHVFVYEKTPYSRPYLKNLAVMEQIAEREGWDKETKQRYRMFTRDFICSEKHEREAHTINCKPRRSGQVATVDSLKLVRELDRQGRFIPSTVFTRIEHGVKDSRIEALRANLDYIASEQQEYEFKDRAEGRKFKDIIFIADHEATVKGGKHEALYCGFKELGQGEVIIIEKTLDQESVYQRMMYRIEIILKHREQEYREQIRASGKRPRSVDKPYVSARIYFHNLKYDYFLMAKHMKLDKILNKNGQYYQVQTRFKNFIITFVDSWKLISEPLSGFAKMFGLPAHLRKQEAIAYEWYEFLKKGQRCSVDEYRGCLHKKDEKIKFEQNLKANAEEFGYDAETRTFDPWKYYKYYLKYDVLVLEAGLMSFAEKIDELNQKLSEKMPAKTEHISMWDFLTISSISHYFMQVYGVYDGVFMSRGSLRAYLSEAVYGGRTHVNKRYQRRLLKTPMNALDGVSLYPSAIVRMCREIGLPCGMAKKLLDKSIDATTGLPGFGCDHYVVTIRISSVGKCQRMPMIATREKGGIMKYSNDVPAGVIVLDKIALEDWVKFHHIKYEIIDGVYWDGGYNKNMGAVITEMFQMRLDAKKAKNSAMSSVLKLLMNASYGKTITKLMTDEYVPVGHDKHILVGGMTKGETRDPNAVWETLAGESFNQYLYNNYNRILECHELVPGKTWLFRVTKLDNSYNFSHVGGLILSYSKRIMNEIFDVCNSEGFPISYTDTDSIHMLDADVEPLGEKYEEKYGKKLLGERLEQFHCDYTVKDADGKEVDCVRVWADCEIDVDKKMYASYVVGERRDGMGLAGCYHLRMKGISEPGLRKIIEDKFNGDAMKMYEYICQFPLEIDSVVRGEKVKFDFLDHKQVVTRDSFVRSVGGGGTYGELDEGDIRKLWELGEEWELGEQVRVEGNGDGLTEGDYGPGGIWVEEVE